MRGADEWDGEAEAYGFELPALILRMEAGSTLAGSRVKIGYKMIVRQRRVILCTELMEEVV